MTMNKTAELKFSKDHSWLRIEGNEAVVGVTDYAQDQLGDVVYVETSAVGTTIAQNDTFGTIEAVKTVSDIFMPVSGRITAVNESLSEHPEKINSDPYGEGWIVRISMSNPAEAQILLNEADYKKLTF